MSSKYHFSYDTINAKKDFGSYDEARRHLLCVLKRTKPFHISSFCKSTIELEYEDIQFKLFDYLDKNLADYFYYSISMVAVDKLKDQLIEHNINIELEYSLQEDFSNLTCNDLKKEITAY